LHAPLIARATIAQNDCGAIACFNYQEMQEAQQ